MALIGMCVNSCLGLDLQLGAEVEGGWELRREEEAEVKGGWELRRFQR